MTKKIHAFALILALVGLSGTVHADNLWGQGFSTTSQSSLAGMGDFNNWTTTVGFGAGFAPRYSGSDRVRLALIPAVNFAYDRGLVYVGTQGIGMTPVQGDTYHVRVGLGYDMGRYKQDDSKNLGGLDKVDYSILAVVAGDFSFRSVMLNGDIQTALFGDYGTTLAMGATTKQPMDESWTISENIHARFADDQHMEHFYGVKHNEAAASGKSYYEAKAGVEKFGLTVGASYAVTPDLSVSPSATADFLTGDAADSPLTVRNFQPSGRVMTTYRF